MTEDNQDAPVEVDPRTQQALIKKAEADARAAEATARKAEAEAADVESPTAQQARDAKNLLAVAEAEQKAAGARQQQLSALIPDLSKVKDSTVEVSTVEVSKDGPAIGGSSLTFGALADAAKAIVAHIDDPPADGWRILVTSDQDLASPDSLYQEVRLGLTQLAKAADQLVEAADKLLRQKTDKSEVRVRHFGAETGGAAVAAALPHVLSLLSAERSVTTASVTVTDLAAVTAVAGALQAKLGDRVVVVHADFRIIVPGRIHTASDLVATKRQELVGRKLALADRKSAIDAELALAKIEEKDAEKALADADPKAAPHPDLDTRLDNARELVVGFMQQSSDAAVRLGLVESLISSIDAFSAAIRVIPAGGRRSPLATAALLDQLHEGATSQFTHVLLVKAQPAQSAYLTDDRPLWFKDKFSTIVEVNVTYMLIATNDSRVVRAGTATATAAAYGDLGSEISFRTTTPVVGVWEEDSVRTDKRNRSFR